MDALLHVAFESARAAGLMADRQLAVGAPRSPYALIREQSVSVAEA